MGLDEAVWGQYAHALGLVRNPCRSAKCQHLDHRLKPCCQKWCAAPDPCVPWHHHWLGARQSHQAAS